MFVLLEVRFQSCHARKCSLAKYSFTRVNEFFVVSLQKVFSWSPPVRKYDLAYNQFIDLQVCLNVNRLFNRSQEYRLYPTWRSTVWHNTRFTAKSLAFIKSNYHRIALIKTVHHCISNHPEGRTIRWFTRRDKIYWAPLKGTRVNQQYEWQGRHIILHLKINFNLEGGWI